MSPPDRQREILIATGNPGKFREIVQVLATEDRRVAVRWRSLPDLTRTIPAPAEDGRTFPEIAALKARYYAGASGFWTLADDSGLEVDALGGAPGVISARYAGTPEGTPRAEVDRANNRRLITALRAIPSEQRTARFRCALALSDGENVLATAGRRRGGVDYRRTARQQRVWLRPPLSRALPGLHDGRVAVRGEKPPQPPGAGAGAGCASSFPSS